MKTTMVEPLVILLEMPLVLLGFTLITRIREIRSGEEDIEF